MNVRLCTVVWLLGAGCTIEQGGTDDFAVQTSGMTTSGTTSESVETSGSSSSSTSSAVDTSGGGESTSSSSGLDTTGTTAATGSETGAVLCGNGEPDGDEECDDGNKDEFDACTSQCTVPVCDDGLHNGDETDVDCGGTCQGCALCAVCEDADDCDGDMRCDERGQCVTHFDIEIDWVANCPGQAQGVTLDDLAAGTYRATASPSAGTLWSPPHNPPSTGYLYEAECTGVTFTQMRTPAGVRYINAGTAYGMLESYTETFDYAGGDMTCWLDDGGCDDNDGSVAFSLDYVCEQ